MNKKLTTSLPMSVEMSEYQGNPQVFLSGVGELELKNSKADFYVTLPGTYTLTFKDKVRTETLTIQVEQHQYLDFTNEFGVFFVLFLFVMGGIILWTRKIMKKKIA